jgi:hypothetical protein
MFADPDREDRARAQEKGSEMKYIMGTALRVTACATLLMAGAALLAGKGDIRKFHRMRCM